MKNLLILWDEPLIETGGGIHRTINCLKEKLPPRGINVIYMYSKDGYNNFNQETAHGSFIYNLNELRDYIIDNEVNYILGQEAAFSSTLTKAIKKLGLLNVKLLNQYHCTLLYFDKKLDWDYLKHIWINNRTISSRLSVIIRSLTYPFWRKHATHVQNNIYRYNYTNSDVTILLSEYEKPILAKITHDSQLLKCKVINNPLTWDKIETEEILQNKKKEVLIVSRIYNIEKRIDLALKAWKILESKKECEDWKLRIVGEGVDKEFLMSMTHKLGLKNVIWEPRQDPKPLYQNASIFILSSIVEGWALTLTESMQNGVVPVAFDSYPAVRSIISDGYDGFLVPTKNIQLLAQKLYELMTDEDLRNNMALNGLKSSERFLIDKIIDQWVDMFNSL